MNKPCEKLADIVDDHRANCGVCIKNTKRIIKEIEKIMKEDGCDFS